MTPLFRLNDRAFLAARHTCDRTHSRQCVQRRIKAVRFKQSEQFIFIGEKDIRLMFS